jgi:SAM-dependent methyltransferase
MLPELLLVRVRAYRNHRQVKQFEGLSDKEIFDSIYRQNMWGGQTGEALRSGSGSTPEQSEHYENLVVDFVDQNEIKTVLDFGCGNFQVSERIHKKCKTKPAMTGIDISDVVIERNTQMYRFGEFKFIKDDGNIELPESDLITIRQVLQHNSNENIMRILSRVRNRYFHLIIAEHVPHNPREKNLNFPTSMLTRMTIQSGVFVDEPPFNLPVEKVVNIDWSALDLEEGLLRVTFTSTRRLRQ